MAPTLPSPGRAVIGFDGSKLVESAPLGRWLKESAAHDSGLRPR